MSASVVAVRMSEPDRCFSICCPTYLQQRNVPVSTRSMISRQTFSASSVARVSSRLSSGNFMALWKNASIRPKRATAAATAACTCSLLRTSSGWNMALSPPNSATTARPFFSLRSATTTAAPAAAKARAPARPMPDAAPVMRAILPLSSDTVKTSRGRCGPAPATPKLRRLESLVGSRPIVIAGMHAVRLQRRHGEELRLLLELRHVVVRIEALKLRRQLVDRGLHDDPLVVLFGQRDLAIDRQ